LGSLPRVRLPLPLAAEIAVARVAGQLSRLAGAGGGTTIPGKLLWKLDPDAVDRLASRLPLGSALLSATNGKTTTAAMAARILGGRVQLAHNSSGANLVSGVASTLLDARGAELGLFEVDEAALSEVAAPAVLGRTVGTFAAAQTAGLMLAPILGGLLGEISWRLAFVLVAVVAVVLALPRQTLGAGERQPGTSGRASLRSLLNRWIALLATQATLGYLGFTAIGFVLVLVGAEEFNLGSGARGLLIAGYGIGGILLGRYAGSVVDRAGRPATALAGTIACTAGVLGLVIAPSPSSLALVFFGVGCASAFVWAGLNTIAVESFPENRAGATSAYSAFKFAGVAIAPLIYVPLFQVDTRLPFLLAAGFSALLAVSVVPWFSRYR